MGRDPPSHWLPSSLGLLRRCGNPSGSVGPRARISAQRSMKWSERGKDLLARMLCPRRGTTTAFRCRALQDVSPIPQSPLRPLLINLVSLPCHAPSYSQVNQPQSHNATPQVVFLRFILIPRPPWTGPHSHTSFTWPSICRPCFHDHRIYVSSQQLFLFNASLYPDRSVLFSFGQSSSLSGSPSFSFPHPSHPFLLLPLSCAVVY